MHPRIVAFPAGGIAYNEGLYRAFGEQGVEVVEGVWAGRWLLDSLRRTDVVHIHWPSFLYGTRGSKWQALRAFVRFALLLGLVRWCVREIWWTAHNLMPHEANAWPALDTLGRRLTIAASRRVFVHGPGARQVLVERFPSCRHKVVEIPHGHWIGFYPPCASRSEARTRLELPQDAVVFLLFGQCKPYKNLESLIEAFQQLDGPRFRLVIAGGFSDKGYLARVRERASADPRIHIEARFIEDSEVSLYLMACNAMCMPYREILTSGTAMLALSYGRPVLSLRRGFLLDVITPEAGVLIERTDVPSILQGLRELCERSWDDAAILAHCQRFSFEAAARISLGGLETTA